MNVQFGQFHLEIDVDKTREFYETIDFVSEGCSCAGCRNYERAADALPDEVRAFFDTIGINIKKVCEVYVHMTNPDGTVYYGGFYHLCGKLVKGDSAWVEESAGDSAAGDGLARTFHWEHSNTYSVSRDFHVSFQEECSLVEPGFPTPVLQMEIEANIPWVLEEENTYI